VSAFFNWIFSFGENPKEFLSTLYQFIGPFLDLGATLKDEDFLRAV